MLASPAAFAAANNQQPSQAQQKPSQGQQQLQHDQTQGKAQNDQHKSGQNAQNQQGSRQQSAENSQPISPQEMSRNEIRQVQQALDKDGFKAGPTDGRWGRETETALKQFQQSKQLQATGQLDQQTVADLGLDSSQFSQSQNQQK
jgi:hypothetical protein